MPPMSKAQPLRIAYNLKFRTLIITHRPPPPLSTILAVTKLYSYHCHCQPLPLFRLDQLRECPETYNWEVLFAILAVALRFSDDTSLRDDMVRRSREYAERSLQLVMKKVTEGKVELSTLQALCLLAFKNFTGMSWIALLQVTGKLIKLRWRHTTCLDKYWTGTSPQSICPARR
jgi:hypothetical protein